MKNRQEERVIIETDSMLAVQTINGRNDNLLEVGHVVVPYFINCSNIFTSPPIYLLETVLFDVYH